jgi:putative nucleotidyltransferase with HDIG domain
MFRLFNRLLDQPLYFRFAFFLLLFLSITLNGVLIESNSNFYLLYIFCVILIGIGFYDWSLWFIVLLTVLVVICRFFLIPDPASDWMTFLTYLCTYLLVTLISVGLMRNSQRVKEDHMELTIALSKALDSRDTYTLHHSENVARYAVNIAEKLKLSKDQCTIIRIGGLLHDIGKIGIPEHILNKPGKLTEDEFAIIKDHPTIGYEIIKHISYFKQNGILDIVLYHHERYDGKGYPSGLKGDQIPLVARIVAVADTFDAMSSRRVYRNELELNYILNEIRNNKETQFDPQIVDIFLSLFDVKTLEEKVRKEQKIPVT